MSCFPIPHSIIQTIPIDLDKHLSNYFVIRSFQRSWQHPNLVHLPSSAGFLTEESGSSLTEAESVHTQISRPTSGCKTLIKLLVNWCCIVADLGTEWGHEYPKTISVHSMTCQCSRNHVSDFTISTAASWRALITMWRRFPQWIRIALFLTLTRNTAIPFDTDPDGYRHSIGSGVLVWNDSPLQRGIDLGWARQNQLFSMY
jgi:hypothetical protein